MNFSHTYTNKEKLQPTAIAMLGNRHCYFNTIDVLEKLSIEKSKTVIIVYENTDYLKKGISLIDIIDNEWLDVIDISYRDEKSIISKMIHRYLKIYWAIKAKNILKRIDTTKTQFFISPHYDWESDLSAYRSIMNPSKKYLVIDDGMKNIVMEARREKELSKGSPTIFNQSAYNYLPLYERVIRRVLCTILYIPTTSLGQLNWYTKLPLSSFRNRNSDLFVDLSTECEYKPIVEKKVHYISQPIPKFTSTKAACLRKLFNTIIKRNAGSKIYYFPHRFESYTQTKLAEEYFEIVKPNCDYENYLKALDAYPSTIISFYSSVLFTLHKYHKTGIKFLSIYDDQIYESNENLELVYEAIDRAEYIRLIKF